MTALGYTLDSNIIRPLLRREDRVVSRLRHLLSRGGPVKINALSYFETKRGLLAADASTQLVGFEQLCATLGVLLLDRPVLDKASEIYARLRREGKLIEDADLLIAATALEHDLCLVTNNTAHFERVSGLELEDWIAPNDA